MSTYFRKRQVHQSFYLVPLLDKGIVYIHGKIPTLVKEYLESKFKNISDLKFIVANQVILEGINLPIDTLFITSTFGLDGKGLTNLIGRVNRLNYVFNHQSLNSLISQVHFLNNPTYQGSGNIKNKVKLLRDHSFKDNVENPLLESYDINKLSLTPEVKEKREKADKIIIQASDVLLSQANLGEKEKIKKYLIENSIDAFYKNIDRAIDKIYDNTNNYTFAKDDKIVDIVSRIFILNNTENIGDYEIERLKNIKAVNYYNYYLEITQKQALKERINSTVKYFTEKSRSVDTQLYIGKSYGEEVRRSTIYQHNEYLNLVYVNLRYKTPIELVNLAIVKLKIEEDFVGFKLNKLIMFLYDFKLIPEEYYFEYIYGTTNIRLINLVRFGLNVNIIKKLDIDNQIDNLYLDENGNLNANQNFKVYLFNQSELFKFEINKFLI